jgi:predicted DNA-binding transcriptional regulator AlpA
MSTYEEVRLLRRVEVEEQFGIPVRFLEIAVSRGDGPPIVRLGRSVRYRVCDVRNWIEQRVEGCING